MDPVRAALPPVEANPRWRGYECVLCGAHQGPDYLGFVCPACGSEGILDAVYGGAVDRRDAAVAGDRSLWRFAPWLPVRPSAPHPAWSLGGTPVHEAPRLAADLGCARLLLKDDTVLPSASLKDRAAAVALAHWRLTGHDRLACASTGNAAASLAVLAARAGAPCTIFVPAAAPRAKLAQLVAHGADVVRVDGSYDQAFDLSLDVLAERGWYSRNCAHNAVLVEGKKTATLELAADLTSDFTRDGDDLPDAVFVPVGDGCIVSSAAKAWSELHAAGLIPRVPRVYGVQAAGAAPLAAAWARAGDDAPGLDGPAVLRAVTPVAAETRADSICVGVPRNRVKAWRRVAATGGGFLAVEDGAILAAIRALALQAGVFAEPSGAAGLAGVAPALANGLIAPHETVAVMVTGHGLKDPQAALADVELAPPVAPGAGLR